MGKTKIEWCDYTWSPVSGCSKTGPGCLNCFAERMDRRQMMPGRKDGFRSWTVQNAEYNVRLHPERLEQPLHWKTPRRIFVCSMSDLFHEQVPGEFIAAVFAVMAAQAHHTFTILTKRPRRMCELMTEFSANPEKIVEGLAVTDGELQCAYYNSGFDPVSFPLPNVMLGISAEDQKTFDERVMYLLQTPAAIHFVSCEPLLGPVDLSRWM